MANQDGLAKRFEENRGRLRGVAYRMLGSMSEADDAVQEAWLRLGRASEGGIENLDAWLTTVTARVCLDMLRSRASRREESLDEPAPAAAAIPETAADPEQEAALADSVGLALLVVLDRLAPAERLAFVLHDMFAMSFDEIGRIVGRSPAAARQLASRARRRVQGADIEPGSDLARQREVAEAFLTALRAGDFEGLMAVLDPDVVVRADRVAAGGTPREIRGAANWARGAIAYSRAVRSMGSSLAMLLDGSVGLVWAPRGRLERVLRFKFNEAKIAEVEIIADRGRLEGLELAVLGE